MKLTINEFISVLEVYTEQLYTIENGNNVIMDIPITFNSVKSDLVEFIQSQLNDTNDVEKEN